MYFYHNCRLINIMISSEEKEFISESKNDIMFGRAVANGDDCYSLGMLNEPSKHMHKMKVMCHKRDSNSYVASSSQANVYKINI